MEREPRQLNPDRPRVNCRPVFDNSVFLSGNGVDSAPLVRTSTSHQTTIDLASNIGVSEVDDARQGSDDGIATTPRSPVRQISDLSDSHDLQNALLAILCVKGPGVGQAIPDFW
jgi:hypothetical protein